MILLITGATHTGKTALAQRVLEARHWPYLSLDHLKMGMIRSGLCPLKPDSSLQTLTAALWPVAREMIKTSVENGQNLIVEGCYIPPEGPAEFLPEYRRQMRCVCLLFSPAYQREHFDEIQRYADVIEQRQEEEELAGRLAGENRFYDKAYRAPEWERVLIDKSYDLHLEI